MAGGARPYFLPHPPHAEDQPYAAAILTTHVLYRGLQTGALLGGLGTAARAAFGSPSAAPLAPRALRGAGVWALWFGGGSMVAVAQRMWGREHVEWQDRAWRLLESPGQRSVDRWSAAGALAGAVLARGAARAAPKGWLVVLGGMGVGSLAGAGGSVGWRLARGEF